MTPYAEKPLGYVEVYEEIPGGPYLRLQYKVQLYEPFPTRAYQNEHWIVPSPSALGRHRLLHCPPSFKSRYGFAPHELSGVIDIGTSVVRLDLRYPNAQNPKNATYQFNGEWKLIRVEGPGPAPTIVHARECEPAS
jgi:hypothetical protein